LANPQRHTIQQAAENHSYPSAPARCRRQAGSQPAGASPETVSGGLFRPAAGYCMSQEYVASLTHGVGVGCGLPLALSALLAVGVFPYGWVGTHLCSPIGRLLAKHCDLFGNHGVESCNAASEWKRRGATALCRTTQRGAPMREEHHQGSAVPYWHCWTCHAYAHG
jgi:hypothetical protein